MDALCSKSVAARASGFRPKLLAQTASRGHKLRHSRRPASRAFGKQQRLLSVRAQEGQQAPSADDEAEARLEALEAAAKRKGGAKTVQQPARKEQAESPGFAEWKEGQLFPEGWEEMDQVQKVTELWAGQRGALYWMTQSAWYSVLILGVMWVIFRFVGPALGLYKLASDFSPPPM